MIMEILTNQNPLLRKVSKPVKKVTKEIRELAANMEETLRAAPGIGLAAPQVGQSIRMIIADIGEGLYVLINPKVIKKKGKQIFTEGCLSLPGIEAPVERANHIIVKATDLKGKLVQVEAQDLLATAFQHEIDHLDGTIFIDRADPETLETVPLDDEDEEED